MFAVLVKLGTGPWVFYKLNVYKGLSVHATVIYTAVYFSAVLVFLFNVLNNSGFAVSSFFGPAASAFVSLSAVLFGANVFQNGSVVLFLSFSSLLNLVFMVLQVV